MPQGKLTGDQREVVPSKNPYPVYIQLTNMYAPSWGYGGPVRMLFDYAGWLTSDYRVAVFSGDIHHDFTRLPIRSEVISEIPVYRQRIFLPKLVRKSIYLISPGMFLRAARLIRSSSKKSIVHFSELRGLISLYALALKMVFGKRVLLVHSAFGSLHFKPGARRRFYDALFMKPFLKLIDIRIAQNTHEQQTYEQLYRERGLGETHVDVLPLHVDDTAKYDLRFSDGGKKPAIKDELRAAYGIPKDALVFIFLGRLHPEKGILRTIDAYLEFARSSSRPNLLLIVGRDDGFQSQVEGYIAAKRVQDSVRVVTNVYESRFDYYFLADIFLGFPTIFEETMLASIEAMACGTPILVSREADIPFVDEEHAGVVIDFDVQNAAHTMRRIVDQLSSMQVNARRAVIRHFGGEAASSRLKRLLNSTDSKGLSHISPVTYAPDMARSDHAPSEIVER